MKNFTFFFFSETSPRFFLEKKIPGRYGMTLHHCWLLLQVQHTKCMNEHRNTPEFTA